MIFTFEIFHKKNIDSMCGQLKMTDDNYWIAKWFNPRLIDGGITLSDNDELFSLKVFEKFMSNIRNNVNCVYRRDNEDILIFHDNTFRINTESCQTGLNYDSSLVDFKIDVSNPLIKEELLSTLQSIYDWIQSILIENVLIANDL